MSTLTKVFIIIQVVFSIAFTAMTVSIASQTTNWKATADKYQEHARVADTNLRNMIAASAAELATAKDEITGQVKTIGSLEAELQKVRGDGAQLRAEQAKATSEKSSAEAMNRGLLAQLQVAEAGRTELRTQRDDLEKRAIDLERRNIDLNDRVNEQTAKISVMLEQRRQYEQQINILRTENEKQAGRSGRAFGSGALEEPSGAALSGVSAVKPSAPAAIRGSVVQVDGTLIKLSVGSADGVRKDMLFVVHRGGQYVGDIQITVVDPNESAGRIVRSVSLPQAGDQVTDASRMGSSRG